MIDYITYIFYCMYMNKLYTVYRFLDCPELDMKF